MKECRFISDQGNFILEDPEMSSYLYFPIANEAGTMSSITPDLGGDMKISQNAFLLPPVSSENLHNDKAARNVWLKINGKKLWSAVGRSAAQQAALFTEDKEKTLLEAGFMQQKLTRVNAADGIRAEITSFVPDGQGWMEYHRVSFENTGDSDLRIQPVIAVPVYGRSADNIRDHRHVTSLLHRIRVTENGAVVTPTMTFDERGHHENQLSYGVFAGNKGDAPVGVYPDTEDFIGEGGSYENPGALRTMEKLFHAGDTLDGYEACGTMVFGERILKPGEKRTLLFVLIIGARTEDLQRRAEAYLSEEVFEKHRRETEHSWQERTNVRCFSGEEAFDRWMRWVSFQPMLRRIYGCSFLPHHDYGKGGRGWRDLWQDCLALLVMNPSGVRQMMTDNFGGVRLDGTNATIIGDGQGNFLADRNGIARVWMDHGMWPFLTLQYYLDFTGDDSILTERARYFKDRQAVRGDETDEAYCFTDAPVQCTEQGTVYMGTLLEHLLLENLTAVYDVGGHNEIRLRGADWNDALDMAKERGESVAFTGMYADNLEKLAVLLDRQRAHGQENLEILEEAVPLLFTDAAAFADPAEKRARLYSYCRKVSHSCSGRTACVSLKEAAEALRSKSSWIRSNIRANEWLEGSDPEEGCFNGYYDNSGRQLESLQGDTVRMMLTSQVFAIMSGTAEDAQIRRIIRTADRWLYREDVGGYRLNTDFREVKYDMGRMFGFAYGQKENGAVFSHMAVMYANALYRRGYAAEGFRAIHTLYRHCMNFEKSRIYPGVPEYIDVRGRGMYHYLTGAASWLLLTVITEMYGVHGKNGSLCLKPALLKEQFDSMGQASLELVFQGKKLRIEYRNPQGRTAGSYRNVKLTLDGRTLPDAEGGVISQEQLAMLAEGETHVIAAELAG